MPCDSACESSRDDGAGCGPAVTRCFTRARATQLARRAVALADRQVSRGGGLTPREAEVLALVAAGRSNRQIAQLLFISLKTASVHVSNILAKLGVSGRLEAAAVAHRLGLDTDSTHA